MLGPDSFRRELAAVTQCFSHVLLRTLKQFSLYFYWEEGLCKHEVPVSMSFLCRHFWIHLASLQPDWTENCQWWLCFLYGDKRKTWRNKSPWWGKTLPLPVPEGSWLLPIEMSNPFCLVAWALPHREPFHRLTEHCVKGNTDTGIKSITCISITPCLHSQRWMGVEDELGRLSIIVRN